MEAVVRKVMGTLLTLFLAIGLLAQPTLAQASSKVKVVKVKLPSGGVTTIKGTKVQIFKIAEREAKKRDALQGKLEQAEVCQQEDCAKIEDKIANSEKIIEVITKSLYSKAADASMLSPITKTEYRFFANQVRQEIKYVEEEIKEIQEMKNAALNSYLSTFESSYFFQANYTKDLVIQVFLDRLQSQLNFLNKVLGGFVRYSIEGNQEGTTEVNISRRQSVQELITSAEQNMQENLNRTKQRQ